MDQSVCVPCCLVRPKCDRTQSLSNCVLSHIVVGRFVAQSKLCLLFSVSWCLVRAAFVTSVTKAAQLIVAVSAKNNAASLCFAFISVSSDSSPTRLLIPVSCCNIWSILLVSVANSCLSHPSPCGGLELWCVCRESAEDSTECL